MKPRVGFFDFAGCEGCQLQIANLEEQVIDLMGAVEVVSFREVMKEHSDDYDIAFVEGCIERPMDAERLKDIRTRAKLLVALGACAHTGCVHKLRGAWHVEDVKKEVYGIADPKDIQGNPYFEAYPNAKALNEVVTVDAYIPGCPINKEEFVRVAKDLLLGKKPRLPNYPVCVECKKNENICVFELGQFCLGPVTRAGCNAACPNYRGACEGCRGYLDDPNMNAEKEIIKKYGFSVEEMMAAFNMFNFRKEGY
ncbi:MAG: NADH:ubiquinone oxidoreductase [Candidatus Thermoplasmatota archaeon]